MSLLNRVWVYLKCQRCDKIHQTDIRFHNWENTEEEELTPGERVLNPYAIVGEVYDGNADRYCPACFLKWAEDQALLAYESLAELVEHGRVSATDPVSRILLPKEDLLEYGRRYTEEMKQSGCIVVTPPYFNELDLSLGSDRVIVGGADFEEAVEQRDTWGEFLTQFDPLLDRRMRDAGWHESGITYEDFRVYLDEDRHIIVEDETGKRLTPGSKHEASR